MKKYLIGFMFGMIVACAFAAQAIDGYSSDFSQAVLNAVESTPDFYRRAWQNYSFRESVQKVVAESGSGNSSPKIRVAAPSTKELDARIRELIALCNIKDNKIVC